MDPFKFPPPVPDDGECCGPEDEPTLSPRDLEMVLSAERDLTKSLDEMRAIWDELFGQVQADLDQASADMDAEIAAISGDADLQLTEAEQALDRLTSKASTEALKQLNSTLDELYSYGITAPYSVGAMADALAGDPTDMVIAYVPPIRDWIGTQTGTAPPPPISPFPAFPAYPGAEPYPTPTPTPIPPTVPPPPAPDDDWLPPWSPDVPPVPPTTTTVPSGNGACPDVNVTVVVPPVTVLYPPTTAGAPPGPVPPTLPPTVPLPPGVPAPPVPPPNAPPVPPPNAPPTAPGSPPTAPPVPPGQPTPVITPSGFPGVPAGAMPGGVTLAYGPYVGGLQAIGKDGRDWNTTVHCPAVKPSVWTDAATRFAGQFQWPAQGGPPLESLQIQPGVPVSTVFRADKLALQTLKDVAEKATDKATYDEMINRAMEELRTSLFGQAFTPDSVRDYASAMRLGGFLALAAKAEQSTGFPAVYLSMGERYAMQHANPMFLPSQDEINRIYLTNNITSEMWECWTRAVGNLPEPARMSLLSQQSKPGMSDLINLWFRGNLSDESLFKRAREIGVLDGNYVKEWVELSKTLPTMTDLLRFMVRDADDPTVVEQYKLDTDFNQKYQSQIKKWGQAIGLPEDVFRYFWRSHWEIPSNTQLYEMLQRLRPDRPEVIEFQEKHPVWKPMSEMWVKNGGPLIVTAADVKRALQVNDLMPGWVDPAMAVSYRPITRTDAVRAYEIGSFTEDQLYHALRDNGYNETNARTLVSYYQQLRARRKGNTTGTWSIRKVVRFYKAGTITKDEAVSFMAPLMPDMNDRLDIVRAADQELGAEQRGREIRALRKGYMLGEFTTEEAELLLTKYGMDTAQAAWALRAWQVDRDGRYKQPSTAQITGWVVEGLVPASEGHRRLMNLGYSSPDAEKIIELAVMKAEAKGDVTSEQIGGVFEQAIKNARQARQATEGKLEQRVGALQRELVRVMTELSRRRVNAGQPPLDDLFIGPRR